ncbi:hypothetical protein MHBO_000352 [Bonamia ostreae]|uniref:Tyrosine-protein kinase ephrin type A/B receptor-like domain-containing protein n=1 Tax=Bonamia ostreae TaxID=126728 RepID=A0ABV2AFB6_9EUKA
MNNLEILLYHEDMAKSKVFILSESIRIFLSDFDFMRQFHIRYKATVTKRISVEFLQTKVCYLPCGDSYCFSEGKHCYQCTSSSYFNGRKNKCEPCIGNTVPSSDHRSCSFYKS